MDKGWQRRQAIQITAQLPEGREDALLVLEFARELVEGFLSGKKAQSRVDGERVLAFPGASAGCSTAASKAR
jgi:hypothetical protein